ncbi:aldo/keto reductase [Streptomyces sp. MBT84]|uniref:aldo/keto reductase n=2 Tax=unclassified Streptomyces TaxID=2593676 RepID=UPI0025739A34|nr:aldo/keto reductase [Streptomyces sp. MBT84]
MLSATGGTNGSAVTPPTGPGPNNQGLSRLHVMRALEDSLRQLKTDYIDLYQIHNHDHMTPIEETLSALDDAVQQGKGRYIGCSNLAAWQISKALGISALHNQAKFIANQTHYSLRCRSRTMSSATWRRSGESAPEWTTFQASLLIHSSAVAGRSWRG